MIEAGPIPLSPKRADIWLAFPKEDDTASWRSLEPALSEGELRRLAAFRTADARLQFLAAHTLLRWALSRYADVAPPDWEFGANGYGKPEIQAPAGHRSIRFNLSHTHGLVACAIGPQAELGVDVEAVQRLDDAEGVMELVLTPEERAWAKTSGSGGTQDRFLALWTLKEAYIKARGMGFDLPPMDFRFEDPMGIPRIRFGGVILDDPRRWTFQSRAIGGRHRLGVAVAEPDAGIRIVTVCPAPGGGFTPMA